MSGIGARIAQMIFECSIFIFVIAWCIIPLYIYDLFIDPFLLAYHLLKWQRVILLGAFIILYTLVIVKLIVFLYRKMQKDGKESKKNIKRKKGKKNKESEETTRQTLDNVSINKVNDDSMTGFIRNLSMKYKDVNSIYFNNGDDKSNKKIAKAIHYYACNVNPQDVIVCFDDTMFGKADQGFLLTDSGLHIKYSDNPVSIIPWDKVTGINFRNGRFNDSIDIIVIESIFVNISAESVIKKDTQQIMEIIKDVFNYYQKSNKK